MTLPYMGMAGLNIFLFPLLQYALHEILVSTSPVAFKDKFKMFNIIIRILGQKSNNDLHL